MTVERIFDGISSLDFYGLTQTIFGYRKYTKQYAPINETINDGVRVTMDLATFDLVAKEFP